VGGERAAGEREMWGESARWGSVRCGRRGHGGGACYFPIIRRGLSGCFYRNLQLNVKTIMSWCGFELACRVVSWRDVVSFHVSTYNTKVSISHHEKDLHIYSKVPAMYLH
jgi:hypothetical protein